MCSEDAHRREDRRGRRNIMYSSENKYTTLPRSCLFITVDVGIFCTYALDL